jgi:PEP-CTERM motif
MKKILALTLLAVSFAAPSVFGQGYFLFTTGKSQAYDGFTTPGSSALSANVKVAFLWAAANTLSPFAIASTPTGGNSTTTESYTVAQAWGLINGGATGWTLAVNNGTSAIASVNTAANGSVTYNGGFSFGVTGTAANTQYSLILIGWNGAYADPTTAAANGSAVGWSSVFQYNSKDNLTTPNNMAAQGANFGVFVPASVPEPSTMALAGLGGAAMLLFRRRK